MAFRPDSHVEQVAAHLREQLRQGRWTGQMPGALKLEQELGASHTIIDRALRLLEADGLLVNQGPGRRRRIELSQAKPARLRVCILHYEDMKDADLNLLVDQLNRSGHHAGFAEKSLQQLGMNPKRIGSLLECSEADAWVVVAGSQEVLEWFARQPVPAFALYGRFKDVDIAAAAPRKLPTIELLVERLIELGHRRMVSIVRREHRKPSLTATSQCFLDQLEANGIPTGDYNLPDWDDSPQDLQRLLDSLFAHTPPTALLIDEPAVFLAARDHLARNGICAPERVSLACYDHMPAFDWQLPAITHIAWEPQKIIRCVVRWADQIGKGIDKRRLTLVDSRLVEGGTIGPVAS